MTFGIARPRGIRRRVVFQLIAALGFWFAVQAGELRAVAPWTLERLVTELAAHSEGCARFSETRFVKVLTTPLKSSGTLRYRRPDYLEKHILSPKNEILRVEGDRVTIEDGTPDSPRSLNLGDLPQVQAIIESIRAPLIGNLEVLNRLFQVSLGGSERRWLLALTPREARFGELLRAVYVRGTGDRITRIDIEERNGDRSEMTIEPLR